MKWSNCVAFWKMSLELNNLPPIWPVIYCVRLRGSGGKNNGNHNNGLPIQSNSDRFYKSEKQKIFNI